MAQADQWSALAAVLQALDQAHIAVSGGVDSMTLAHAAHRCLGRRSIAVHAVSPAVPPEATARVEAHAARHGWALRIINAGEFEDTDYRANPVNRCFFCKTNLYGSIARHFGAPILSGTNTDDLGDYRPGLTAAAEHGVRHPYVEVGIDKAGVRALARSFGLTDLAELPASPCLSSRILTGLAVTEARLAGILAVESLLQRVLGQERTLRCRILAEGIELQLDAPALARWRAGAAADLLPEIAALCRQHQLGDAIATASYRRGSAFVGNKAVSDHAV